MIKIRLSREGKRNKPFYRIIAIEDSKKRGGKSVEILGFWNPIKKELNVNKPKIEEWVKKGALLNQSVKRLLEK
jgi:small subunit ribosomal protein S16